jgi:hypothetical protein
MVEFPASHVTDYVGKRNNIWDVWRNRYIDEIILYIELGICTKCLVLYSSVELGSQ